jgi:hypothetical protein
MPFPWHGDHPLPIVNCEVRSQSAHIPIKTPNTNPYILLESASLEVVLYRLDSHSRVLNAALQVKHSKGVTCRRYRRMQIRNLIR